MNFVFLKLDNIEINIVLSQAMINLIAEVKNLAYQYTKNQFRPEHELLSFNSLAITTNL